MNKEDRRTRRTKKILKHVFLQELKRKELEKVSVTSICKIADINRTTFYLHYTDIYELLEEIESDFLNQSDLFADGILSSSLKSKEVTKAVLTYIKENKDILSLFLLKRKDEYFFHRIDSRVKQLFYMQTMKTYNTSLVDEKELNLVLSFYTNGFYSIYKNWLLNECEENIDYIANLTTNLSSAYFDNRFKRK